MSAFLHNLHFLRPAWLLALPLLWGLCLWLSRRRGGDGNWSALIDGELLAGLKLEGAGSAGGLSPWPWLAAAWTVAVLALAGPAWEQEAGPAYRGDAAWVLVLDLSPSMGAADLSPDRVTRARYAIDDVMGAARDTRVGLVAFANEAYTVTPLTEDVSTVRALLEPLTPDIMPEPGDRLTPALELAAELLSAADTHDRRVLVFTDGFGDPASAFSAAQALRAQGATLSVIGVGTPGGAPLPDAHGGFVRNAQGGALLARLDTGRLRSLAESGGGQYRALSALPGLLSAWTAQTSRSDRRQGEDVQLSRWRDAGVWLLLPLLVLAGMLARRGWL